MGVFPPYCPHVRALIRGFCWFLEGFWGFFGHSCQATCSSHFAHGPLPSVRGAVWRIVHAHHPAQPPYGSALCSPDGFRSQMSWAVQIWLGWHLRLVRRFPFTGEWIFCTLIGSLCIPYGYMLNHLPLFKPEEPSKVVFPHSEAGFGERKGSG